MMLYDVYEKLRALALLGGSAASFCKMMSVERSEIRGFLQKDKDTRIFTKRQRYEDFLQKDKLGYFSIKCTAIYYSFSFNFIKNDEYSFMILKKIYENI